MEDVEGTLAATVWILGAVFGLEVSLPSLQTAAAVNEITIRNSNRKRI